MIIQIYPSLVSGHDNHFLQSLRPNKSKSYLQFTLKTGTQCIKKIKKVLVRNKTLAAMIKINYHNIKCTRKAVSKIYMAHRCCSSPLIYLTLPHHFLGCLHSHNLRYHFHCCSQGMACKVHPAPQIPYVVFHPCVYV